MSLESWKKEFYPVPACEVSVGEALAHSLKKWVGLKGSNLDRHHCEFILNGELIFFGGGYFSVDSGSCALCQHWLHSETKCSQCPLFKVRGMACDKGEQNPYGAFTDDDNPDPMIDLIRRAMEAKRS